MKDEELRAILAEEYAPHDLDGYPDDLIALELCIMRRVYNKAIEDAAKVADKLSKLYPNSVGYDVGYTAGAVRAAREIRALATKEGK